MGRLSRWFLLAGVLLLFSSCDSLRGSYEPSMTSSPDAIALAKCLTAKGAKLYSADWCPACRYQKELFGKEAVKYLTIVDTRKNRAECKRMKIRCVPTWILGDGTRLEGVRSLKQLAEESGCP